MENITNFEHIKNLNLDEFAQWILDNGNIDSNEWEKWFDKEYCQNCEPIILKGKKEIKEKYGIEPLIPYSEMECAYCELEKKCKYFPQLNDIPSVLDIIRFWLQKEYTKG